LVIGNDRIVHRRSSLRFFDGLAWFSQMIMFLTLGLLINPKDLWSVALISLIIGSVKRDSQYFIPKGNTELHPDDKLLIITNDENALIETYFWLH
jgi:NhaP-type Na+/H+ and K+/H+ antiporter